MSGEETLDLFRAFRWQILASFSPLVSLIGAAVVIDTVVSAVFVAVFVEALALASAVSAVFVEALILATVLAAFFFPARSFHFARVLLFGWDIAMVGSSVPSFCSVLALHVLHIWPHSSGIVSRDLILITFIQNTSYVIRSCDSIKVNTSDVLNGCFTQCV